MSYWSLIPRGLLRGILFTVNHAYFSFKQRSCGVQLYDSKRIVNFEAMSNLKLYILLCTTLFFYSFTVFSQSYFGASAKVTHPVGKNFLRYGITAYGMGKDRVPESRNYFHWKFQYLFPLTTSQNYDNEELERFDPSNQSEFLSYRVKSSSFHLSLVGARHNFESNKGERAFAGFGVGASMFLFEGKLAHHKTLISRII